MTPDTYQKAWHSQSSHTRVTIDAGLLLKEVERNQRDFRALVFRRDFREVAIGIVMLPLWFFLGKKFWLPWTWYLVVPAMVWVIGFILLDRIRHREQPPQPGEPLLQCVKNSLNQVEHQISLLRNVFWWYLLPFTIALLAFFAQAAWSRSSGFWTFILAFAPYVLFLSALYGFIYYLNQFAVRRDLEPRREELLTLLTSLGDETTDELAPVPSFESAHSVGTLRQWLFIAGLSLVTAVLCYLAHTLTEPRDGAGYPRKAPFTAVRWHDTQPEVRLNDEWLKLVSLNELPTADIIAFSQKTYGDLWRKRFEEDLVELLSRMGHPPRDTVTLVVESLTSSEKRTLEDVPMTEANRRAIRNAAQTREPDEQQPATPGTVPIGDAEAPLTDLIPRLRKEKELVGLSGQVGGGAVISAGF